MTIRKLRGASITLGLGSLLSFSSAMAGSEVVPAEASIPFANHSILNWQADSSRGVWVQANDRQWYYAKFMGPCSGLNFANAIGFDTGPAGSLDRWGAVIVPRYGKCAFSSFEPSDGPAKRKVNG